MPRVGYLFERFPSVGQNFCYREVAELVRQGVDVAVYSIRRPPGQPAEEWDNEIIKRVTYFPEEAQLVPEVGRLIAAGELPEPVVQTIKNWDRKPDFLRL